MVRRLLFIVALVVASSLQAPVWGKGDDPNQDKEERTHVVIAINSVRLYLPDEALRQRIGNDVTPLATYITALKEETAKFWEKAERPKAKGLLIAIGIKPGKRSRAWCEGVEGEIPPETLRKLEDALAKLPAFDVKEGPVAFAIEIKFAGEKVEKFPEIPKAWFEKLHGPVRIPDGVFEVIWPEK